MNELKNDLFEGITEEPREHYTFRFTKEELIPVEKQQIRRMLLKLLLFILASGLFALVGALEGVQAVIGFGFGCVFIGIIYYVKGLRNYKKLMAMRRWQVADTIYDYTVFDGYMILWLSASDSVRQKKVHFSAVKGEIVDNYVVLTIDGALYPLHKGELAQDSAFLALCQKR